MYVMLVLHYISGFLGVYLVYLTFAMKESTEGNWVNRIQELWVQFDDRKKTISESTKEIFEKVAEEVSRTLNKIFGPEMVSVRAIGISGSLSFASLFSLLGISIGGLSILIIRHSEAFKPATVRQAPLLIMFSIGLLIAGFLCIVLALLPMFRKSALWPWLSCMPAAFLLVRTSQMLYGHLAHGREIGIVIALAFSFMSDLFLLVLVRQSLRWIQIQTNLLRIIVAVVIQAAALLLIVGIPYRHPIVWHPEMAKTNTGQMLFALALFNLPTAIASLAFSLSLVVVVLHRLFWPFLSELTYILTRNEVLEKRKTVRSIGYALFIYAILGSGFWRQIAQKVMR